MSRTDRWTFFVPAAVLVLAPLLCLLAVYVLGQHFDFAVFLLVVVVCWVRLPGMMFGKPLFDLTGIGYSPHDWVGWVVVIVFYTTLSLSISMLVQLIIAMSRRHLTRRCS